MASKSDRRRTVERFPTNGGRLQASARAHGAELELDDVLAIGPGGTVALVERGDAWRS